MSSDAAEAIGTPIVASSYALVPWQRPTSRWLTKSTCADHATSRAAGDQTFADRYWTVTHRLWHIDQAAPHVDVVLQSLGAGGTCSECK